MHRFVLLYHDCRNDSPRESHCDLMLEANGALRTWALAELPCSWGAIASLASSASPSVRFVPINTVAAQQIADHRLAYLDYEGPVSGNRGTVTRLDCGEYASQEESPNHWALKLTGHIIRGQVTLFRVALDDPTWQLKFEAAS
jgi:DNA polymerase Ligase (LigD)